MALSGTTVIKKEAGTDTLELTAGKVGLLADIKVGDATYKAVDNSFFEIEYSEGIGKLNNGKVEFNSGTDLVVGSTIYTAGSGGARIECDAASGNAILIAGQVILGTGESITVNDGTTNLGTIINNGSKDIMVKADGAVGSVGAGNVWSALAGGEVFTTIDTTGTHTFKYTIKAGAEKVTVSQITEGEEKKTTCVYPADGTIAVQMKAKEGVFTNADIKTEQTDGELTGVIWASGKKSEIVPVAEIKEVRYYDEQGIEITTAELQKDASIIIDGTKTTKTVTIKNAVDDSLPAIDLTGANVAVSDSTITCTFEVGGATVAGKSFGVDGSNVIISASGTIKVTNGSIITSVQNMKVDMSGSDPTSTVTFIADTKVTGAEVAISGGNKIAVTETGTGTQTVIHNDGSVEGLDGNATVTGVPAGKTVATTGDGRVTINGRNYTLSGSQSGITYVVASSGISGISGLTGDAVLKLEGSFFSSSLTFLDDPASPKTFTDIKSVDGIEISKGSGGYTVTLNRVDERFTSSAGITYRLKEAGSSVTVAEDGSITGLSNGTRISLTDSTGTVTMEVKDSILVIKKSDGSTLAYKQEDDSVPFGVTATRATLAKLDFKVTGQSTDSTETASMGTDPSGQAGLQIDGVGISTVTNGTYLDKNGNVTMDSSKATAEITIADSGDEVRYEARTDRAQQLDINAGTGAANMEWDITTGKGADSINLVSSKDSVIDAGEGRNNISVGKENTGGTVIRTGSGNDTINVAGSGDALVEAAGGKNRIAHTGTGTATLKGGSGNDTISSSNEDDIIQLGDGKDILKMTSGVTNTVSDYQYGEDKLCLASTKGKLSADKIKIIEDGTISYGTDDGAVKLGEGKSFYAATLVDADGENKLNVGWTGAHGGTIDASAEKAPLVLIGNPDADGESILMGGKGQSTIISGSGHTSLWGGTGNALLIGAEDARDEFFFFGESGRDTISGFTAGTEDNSDVLNLFGSTVTGIKSTEKGVEISTSDKSKLLIQGLGVNDKIQWVSGEAKGVAKIGARNKANTFIYEDDVTNYVGGNKSDTLSVSGDSNSVWLEGIGSSIEIIDASRATGDNVLAGSHESQTIKGGWGSTSLWGGAGGNDSLVGGNGYNEFYFGMGEGKDIITNSNDDDKIMLYNVKTTDLNAQATGMRHGNMVITLNDGSSLTIRDYSRQGATSFQFKDGTYTYDRSTGTWNEKK